MTIQPQDQKCQYQLNDGPCNQPILRSDSSYSGWEHAYQEANGQKVDWLHWASPEVYGPEDSEGSKGVFVPCAVCGKTGPENEAHTRYDGHPFRVGTRLTGQMVVLQDEG